MLQRLLLSLIRMVTGTFFKRIEVVGQENIPEQGPVIFAGNHPNAFMDGWLVTVTCGRWPLHFMANAKLWKYRVMVPLLNAMGAVPVYRHEEHEGVVDNTHAFEKLYAVLESGNCMGIFPEGISHAESQLARLKTGAARVALEVAARGKTSVRIVACGLNYIHRHRFRSQVFIEYSSPMIIDEKWLSEYRDDPEAAVRELTDALAAEMGNVTLNAPDWRTLRFIQTARRLYKPKTAELTPGQYIELNRRFIDSYLEHADDPSLQAFRAEVENYQSRLDMLGIRDYQLRRAMLPGAMIRKTLLRVLKMIILLPLAIPGAALHLPIGWAAAMVGEKFSYELDDVATLKVLSTLALLPVVYIVIAVLVGGSYGWFWALVAIALLAWSFFISVRLIEAQAGIMNSIVLMVRLLRLGDDVEDLRATRARLVGTVRDLADRLADENRERIIPAREFTAPR